MELIGKRGSCLINNSEYNGFQKNTALRKWKMKERIWKGKYGFKKNTIMNRTCEKNLLIILVNIVKKSVLYAFLPKDLVYSASYMCMCVIVLLDKHHILSEKYRVLWNSYKVIQMNLQGPVSEIKGLPEFKFYDGPNLIYSSD